MAEERNTLQENGEIGPKMTDWSKEPSLQDLKKDWESSKPAHDAQISKMNHWNDLLFVRNSVRPKKVKGRSSVQPKLVRRQAEWRYSALSEPFLGSEKLYTVSPSTFEDALSAKQNELVLNHQWRTKLNKVKFIDELVRTTVDEGTCIIQVGWIRQVIKVDTKVPIYDHVEITTEEEAQMFQQMLEQKNSNPRGFEESATSELIAALDYYEEEQVPTVATDSGKTETAKVEKILVNHPTATIRNPQNVWIDPSCEGDILRAAFVGVTFETTKIDLKKEGKRYKNLDKVNWEAQAPLNNPDHASRTPENFAMANPAMRKVVAYEYWGFHDIKNDGVLVPFVATWIGDVLIRMEESPFPDERLPFVVIPYLPIKRELYGEPDAELLEDNQAILGAVTRGMIDLLGRSANGQQGMAKGMLDPLNRRRFDAGEDYEFNPNLSPALGVIDHKYPEIPQSGMMMINMQNADAEALTGVKSFSGGMSGDAFGKVAVGIRGMLDAASKREMAILRRIAQGVKEIGEKFCSMNAVFLSEKETVRITNTEFVVINREDLKGNFDLLVDISTAEVDEAKAQDLGFILQTVGPDEDPAIRRMVLSDIAELKRMPELAMKIRAYKPEPDPLAVKMQELEIAKLEKELVELDSRIALNNAKAEEAKANAELKDLDYVEQETGTKHVRDMDKQRGQARGNQDLEVTKALVKTRKPGEQPGDVEAAIGFKEMTDADDNTTEDDLAATQPPMPAMPAVAIDPTSNMISGEPPYPEDLIDPEAGL